MRGLSGAATVVMLLLAVPLQGQVGPRGQTGMQGQRGMQGHQGMQGQWGMQGQRQMMGGSQQRGMGMGMGSADGILWLSEELSLTDEQVESLRTTNEAARAIHDGARLQMRGMQDQLRDGDITQGQFMDLMTAHRDAMQAQQGNIQEQIDAILSDDQKAQLQWFGGWGVGGSSMMGGRGSGMRGFGHGFNGSGMRGFNRAQMHGRAFNRGFIR